MACLAAKVKTPIFTTDPERQRSLQRALIHTHRRGFTLLELLVVLAIGSLLVALVPPAFDKLRETSQYRDTVRAMVVDLRQAHQLAQAYGRVVNFRVDLAERKFGIEGQTLKALPSWLEVKTTVGSQDKADNTQQALIAFLPEGGSTGGMIELVRPSGGGVRIRVDWLFGQITQHPRAP
jgi:general secretion pathway protein H